MRSVEQVFEPPRPIGGGLALVACLLPAVAAGYLLDWRLALPGVAVAASLVGLLRRRSVRLERDERGIAYLVTGRAGHAGVDLSQLTEVDFQGNTYGVRDEADQVYVGSLDERLRREIVDAASRWQTTVSEDARAALMRGVGGRAAPVGAFVLLGAIGALVPLASLALAVFAGGGIELGRDNRVEPAEVRSALEAPGATGNPFRGREARELFLVPLDASSQQRLTRLAETIEGRFGLRGTPTAPLWFDPERVLDRDRGRLDAWQLTTELFDRHQAAHPRRPAILIGVTRLDTFNPGAPRDRFAFMTTGATKGNVLCGGVISTARFDVWPGSIDGRLAKMAGRLVGRCLGIEETISVRSIRDVDRLDDRAGGDPAMITRRVAERRALPLAPQR